MSASRSQGQLPLFWFVNSIRVHLVFVAGLWVAGRFVGSFWDSKILMIYDDTAWRYWLCSTFPFLAGGTETFCCDCLLFVHLFVSPACRPDFSSKLWVGSWSGLGPTETGKVAIKSVFSDRGFVLLVCFNHRKAFQQQDLCLHDVHGFFSWK